MSRQFVIREPDDVGGKLVPLGKGPGVLYIRIDPALLAVSCERIKRALLAEMDAPDNWQNQIFIDLQRARTLDDGILIDGSPSGGNWTYHVGLPDTVEKTRLITCIVDVLLLEMANRQAERSAEIPEWLGLGLAQDIMRSTQVELVLEPVKPDANGLKIGMVTIDRTNADALALAREDLRVAPPLTLEQLSWPEQAQLQGATAATFRSSAQLFVHELLRLKDGRAAMRSFIQELPQHLNWQLSFLHAFRADFASQLELEKWWALRVVDFTGRDIAHNWSAEESWKKLDEIIRPVVEVREHLDQLPSYTVMPLQTIIEKWDAPRQSVFLKERSKQLFLLRSHVSQDLARLVDDYRKTLDVYLDKLSRDGYLRSPRTQAVMGLDRVTQGTVNDLNLLDSIREDLRPQPQTMRSTASNQDLNR